MNVDTQASRSTPTRVLREGFLRARMAGNDNEWRYVSVRRFFSMVEERKNATGLVFGRTMPARGVKVRR